MAPTVKNLMASVLLAGSMAVASAGSCDSCTAPTALAGYPDDCVATSAAILGCEADDTACFATYSDEIIEVMQNSSCVKDDADSSDPYADFKASVECSNQCGASSTPSPTPDAGSSPTPSDSGAAASSTPAASSGAAATSTPPPSDDDSSYGSDDSDSNTPAASSGAAGSYATTTAPADYGYATGAPLTVYTTDLVTVTKCPDYVTDCPARSQTVEVSTTCYPVVITPAAVPLTTSTVYTTQVNTVTQCPDTVVDCPARAKTPAVVTETIAVSTTVCPVEGAATSLATYTIVQGGATTTTTMVVATAKPAVNGGAYGSAGNGSMPAASSGKVYWSFSSGTPKAGTTPTQSAYGSTYTGAAVARVGSAAKAVAGVVGGAVVALLM